MYLCSFNFQYWVIDLPHSIFLLSYSPKGNGGYSGRRRSRVSIARESAYDDGDDIPDFNADGSEADLNRIITMMADKNRDEETINQILQDWKLLAQKVDYFLFWIFLVMTTVSSALFIFVLPEYNYYMNNPSDFDG